MLRRNSIFLLAVVAILINGCSVELSVDMTAELDGKPVSQAKVLLDGVEAGVTDDQGHFVTKVKRKPDVQFEMSVVKEVPGYRIEPWKESMVVKKESDGGKTNLVYQIKLESNPFVALMVSENKAPVAEASVFADGKKLGKTDEAGKFFYEFKEPFKKPVNLSIAKDTYFTWTHTLKKAKPGDTVDVDFKKSLDISLSAVYDEYGDSKPASGIDVYLGKQKIGVTDKNGRLSYSMPAKSGKKDRISMSSRKYVPRWTKTIELAGQQEYQRIFYDSKVRPVRVGILPFSTNTAGEDLGMAPFKAGEALAKELGKRNAFIEVAGGDLDDFMKRSKMSQKKIATTGWNGTSMRKHVDNVVIGSISKDGNAYILEAKFYGPDGEVKFSQIATASKLGNIERAAKEIAVNAMEEYPFEGLVVSDVEGEENVFEVNIGDKPFDISRKTDFAVYAPKQDKAGRIVGYNEIGVLSAKSIKDDHSIVKVDRMEGKAKVSPGDKVVRINSSDERSKDHVVIVAKGGSEGETWPVQGANIYLNEKWIGATDRKGEFKLPVRIGKGYELVIYRHGYERIAKDFKGEKNGEKKEFVMNSFSSMFTVASNPSGAKVYIDDEEIGVTPITKAKPVPIGFHKVKVDLGGEYRAWEEVVEFNEREKSLTGSNSLNIYKDFLRMGEKAERSNKFDQAIDLYKQANKDHPDYAEAHNRIAQLYLDEKKDPNAAVQEFENVFAIPEVRELVYKQYAVTYTNLGNAYYQQASSVINTDKVAAAKSLGQAIQSLSKAKENTRFFPSESYDIAVHDTYYYLALSYHKLYQVSNKSQIKDQAVLAWREYFDFFPKSLENDSTYKQAKEGAENFLEQLN